MMQISEQMQQMQVEVNSQCKQRQDICVEMIRRSLEIGRGGAGGGCEEV